MAISKKSISGLRTFFHPPRPIYFLKALIETDIYMEWIRPLWCSSREKSFFPTKKKNPFDCEGTLSNYRFPPNTPPVHEFYPLVWPTLLGITRKNDFRQKSRKNTFFVARQFDCGRRPPESNFHYSLRKNPHMPSVIIEKKPRTS